MKRRFELLLSIPNAIWLMMITGLPGEIGFALRYKYWKKRLKFLGKGVQIDMNVSFLNPSFISIDDNSWIDKYVSILAGIDQSKKEKIIFKNDMFQKDQGEIYIGKNCHIGLGCIISGISSGVYLSDNCVMASNSRIYAYSHHYRSKKAPGKINSCSSMSPKEMQCFIQGPIYFGDNVGIALNSIILPGVTIKDNSLVLINSVVYKGIYAEGILLGGNPATHVGLRNKIFEKK